MAKSPEIMRPVDSVRQALERELSKRGDAIKPIELVKVSLSAYLAHIHGEDLNRSKVRTVAESEDCTGLRRGTQAALDRLLFNANYWCAAYESRIIEACEDASDARNCLRAVSVWTTHTLKLNTLSPEDTVATFERFCPPFALNKRRGSRSTRNSGKGPLPDFARAIEAAAAHEPQSAITALQGILADMEAEAAVYRQVDTRGSLNALYAVLPAWCLQDRIALVNGAWWDNYDVMSTIIDALYTRFIELGFGESTCRYFLDSCYEALDTYYRDLSDESCRYIDWPIPDLVAMIERVREEYPSFETDGYGGDLPKWLISKEQLIWNVLVCSLYGPASARPLLVDSPSLLAEQGYAGQTDVMTELARISFTRYTADREAALVEGEFSSFANLPPDLRDSSIAYIGSIHSKLETLGYEILPLGSCYPERRVAAFTDSEVECLAILEHRRWLKEREQAGWTHGEEKDVNRRCSPYMVPWEMLPDRAKEWNRSAVRSIPSLLSSVNLAVVK